MFDLTVVERRKCFHGRLLSEIPINEIFCFPFMHLFCHSWREDSEVGGKAFSFDVDLGDPGLDIVSEGLLHDPLVRIN